MHSYRIPCETQMEPVQRLAFAAQMEELHILAKLEASDFLEVTLKVAL